MKRLLICLLALVASACYGPPPTHVCDPGVTQSCLCPDGSHSSQVCDGDGGGWGTCQCNSTNPPDSGVCAASGTVIINCGCWGYVTIGTTAVATRCCSGYAIHEGCSGFCSGGGIPWGNVCQ